LGLTALVSTCMCPHARPTDHRQLPPTCRDYQEWYPWLRHDSHCHWCGDEVSFEDFAPDHVWQTSKGGPDTLENQLPSHIDCNVARSYYGRDEAVELRVIGLIARRQIKLRTPTGRYLERLRKRHMDALARRCNRQPSLPCSHQLTLPMAEAA
jgi:hypothetical protein